MNNTNCDKLHVALSGDAGSRLKGKRGGEVASNTANTRDSPHFLFLSIFLAPFYSPLFFFLLHLLCVLSVSFFLFLSFFSFLFILFFCIFILFVERKERRKLSSERHHLIVEIIIEAFLMEV